MNQESSKIDFPCIKRLELMEQRADRLEQAIIEIRQGQNDHTAHLTNIAAQHAAALEAEARALREGMSEQTKSILAVSQSMVRLQQAVQKYAAAGTLAGAVVFYIIAKAAGL